jgi:tRNA A-37 threonylcarbamoyl transferase component Bud32
MAEVFLARRRAGGVEKLLVVKRIRAERANDVRFQELFKREAKLSMSLAHQNIVPVFDFGRIGDRFFLAMERVEGKDLGSSLTGERELPPPLVAAFIAAECCQALDYAHSRKNPDGTSRNIVHRDVTPRNVLLSWSGEVKLTDFGIASLAGEDANKHGTPAYMAPEQARGEPVDRRADIYALGMVLREALTGAKARPGDSQEALLSAARAGTLAPWPAHEIDPPLIAIVERATAALPGDRFAEVHELAAELDAYIVAARAAKRGDSPAKQLSAWLARVWGEQREDATESAVEPQAELLSFLDDEGLPGAGTGTQRSLAATAADEADSVAAPAKPEVASSAPSLAIDKPASSSSTPSRARGVVAFAVVAAVALLVLWLATRDRGARSTPDAAVAIEPPRDAAIVAVVDAAVVIVEPDAPVVIDAAVRSDARIVDAAIVVERDAATDARVGSGSARTVPAGSGSGSQDPPPVLATRKVHINATPWAYFTVDGGPRYQTPKLLELTPGPHQLHFENAVLKIERDITLDVPADRDISYVEPLK